MPPTAPPIWGTRLKTITHTAMRGRGHARRSCHHEHGEALQHRDEHGAGEVLLPITQ